MPASLWKMRSGSQVHVLRNMMSSATGDVVKWFVWLSETLVIESEKNTILGLKKELTYKSIASES